MSYIFFEEKIYHLVFAENKFKNHLINITHGCLCSHKVDGYNHRLGLWLQQGKVFVLIFALVRHVTPLYMQWPLAQLFPGAWASSIGQCSVYLS